MYENINYNEIIISGIINNITDTNDLYIKFGITSIKYTTTKNNKIYISLNIKRNLYEIYKDLFYKGNKIFIKGYLNSYVDMNKDIKSFISVTDISNNPNDIIKGRKTPYIRYDIDNVMIWNGKRCEIIPPTEEEQQEMERILDELTENKLERN